MKKLCLVMMVKNEGKIIKRCLDTVKYLVDYIVISDTGSTDNTIEQIELALKDIPHEVHHSKWINFGVSRTEALQKAKGKGDYLLLLDADEVLVDINFNKDILTGDAYYLTYAGNVEYAQIRIIKNDLNWKYVGVTHEYIHCEEAQNIQKITNLKFSSFDDGGNRPEKFQRDIELLTQGLIDEPNNSRYHFYLAQTYNNLGQYEKAISYYSKRIKFGGWEEEVFYSKLQIARCFEALEKYKEAKIYYLEAFEYRPIRVEPLYYLIKLYNKLKEYNSAYLIAENSLKISYPKDILFIDKSIYNYLLLLEVSVTFYWMKKYSEALNYCLQIKDMTTIPKNIEKQNLQNIEWIKKELNPQLDNDNWKNEAFDALYDLTEIFTDNNIPYFLMAGTLLGMQRKNDFIGYHADIDIGILNDSYMELVRIVLLKNNFLLVRIFGEKGKSVEYRFFKNGIPIDIFFFYNDNDKMYFAVSETNGTYYKAVVDKFTLSPAEFKNIPVQIPSNPIKYLVNEYGDWKTPNPNFHYLRDRKNIIKLEN